MVKKRNWYDWVLLLCLGVYLLVMTWVILFKMAPPGSWFSLAGERSVHLLPFQDWRADNAAIVRRDLLDNILVFVPLGILVNALWHEKPLWKRVLPGVGVSLCYEALQFALAIGRSDSTDLLANTLGAVLGIALCQVFWLALKKEERVKKAVALCSAAAGCALLGLVILLLAAN